MTKLVYRFALPQNDGNKDMKSLLGGKGANLAEIANLGIPVPPGFTLSTEICSYFYQHNQNFPESLNAEIASAIRAVEEQTSKKFGEATNPLLLSVRSGSAISMPGMMDTILNLGLNDQTVLALANLTNNPRFAFDSYRRFIQMYSNVVLDIDHYLFEEIIENKKRELSIYLDSEFSASNLQEITADFKELVKQKYGAEFPQDPYTQLWSAIKAVFMSWNSKRAITYRKLNNISEQLGTAVNIQAMVFGNLNENSATGVVFTRNPTNGKSEIFGEFLENAQGEDVVAGIRTPKSINIACKYNFGSDQPTMEETMPEVYQKLVGYCLILEQHFRDMQDIEFTVEDGKLWILQTRNGKRTINSAIKIAVNLVNEGLINKEEAILRIDASSLDKLLHPTIDEQAIYTSITHGMPASPGAASGKVFFSATKAEEEAKKGRVVLVRIETSPEDIHGMHAAEGILTCKGGLTSHAAVVARGMGKPCVCGTKDLIINYEKGYFLSNGIEVKEGEVITINGTTGEVILGEVAMTQPELFKEFNQIIIWANEIKKLVVRANAETQDDSEVARNFGAQGIGLCRSEHMFFEANKIQAVREMILAINKEERNKALAKIIPMQTEDFKKILIVMKNLPVNIRLLDPPFHEFLPHSDTEIATLAKSMGLSFESVKNRCLQLKEHNPMLGHRGCRLGISYPEIYQGQVRSIFEAAAFVEKEHPGSTELEVMLPLIINLLEYDIIKKMIINTAEEISLKYKVKFNYTIGSMIELPAAALCADKLAKTAEFFSFGTNDLTQTTLGLSRDDSTSFLNEYISKGILNFDPFVSIDTESVGELIKIAVAKARSTRKDMKLGICGEHAGDPKSIHFFHQVGLDYISCSPFRVPVAIIAAAQAAIKFKD